MFENTRNKTVDTIGLELTPRERELLLNLFTLDEELEQQIRRVSTSKSLMLTLDELEELAGCIAAEANHTKNKKRQKILDGFYKKIEDLLSQHQEEEPSSSDSEPITIDLSNFSSPSVKIEDKALNYLHFFVDSLEKECTNLGIDIDKLLETLKPIRIEPHQKIGLRLTKEQRELVLGLSGLDESILAQVRNTPPNKQKVELTLGQINELENVVAKTIQQTTDKKTKRKLQLLDGESISIQVKYTVQDDSKPLGPRVFTSPNNLSRGEIARRLLAEMLQARRHKKKHK